MLGVDVVDIERLRTSLRRTPRLAQRLFTDAERDYSERSADPILHLAGALAAKEAVIKAMRLGSLVVWGPRIEIVHAADGAPTAWVDAGSGIRSVEVSISHDGPVAVAAAIRWPD